MDEMKSKVYVLLDGDKITRCEGGYTMGNIQNFEEWTLIDEGDGDKYNLCQSHYFDGGLYTDDGICRWKYVDGQCVLRTDAEIEKDSGVIPAATPSQLDIIEAQVAYTAMMTDTLLEV